MTNVTVASLESLIFDLKNAYTSLKFNESDRFYWSPKTNEIFYDRHAKGNTAIWSLLHETGHALLKHQNYSHDYDLILIEVEAWEKAKKVAQNFGIEIDPDHIEDCLDTYRDWLDKRCTCPTCGNKSLQDTSQGTSTGKYRCFNCSTVWSVNHDRFRRCYRKIS